MAHTSRFVARFACATLAWLLCGFASEVFSQPATNAPLASRLLDFSGNVQVAAAGVNDWRPAVRGQLLRVGDRLRTQADSRAEDSLTPIRFSAASVSGAVAKLLLIENPVRMAVNPSRRNTRGDFPPMSQADSR